MYTLAKISKIPYGIWALISFMLATRFHHFGSVFFLPDASLAIFFMAGLWFGGLRLLAVLMLEAALIDYIAISHLGVSDYCVSAAYGFLIPTYAVMFYVGRLAAPFKTLQTQGALMQIALLTAATSVAFLISNASFYVLSGRFGDLSWMQYLARVAQYYSPYLSSTLIYGVVIVGAVKLIAALSPAHDSQNKAI